MKKRLLIVCLLILNILKPVFSQDDFLPGYIVKAMNDTVFGLIEHANKTVNPDKISFRVKIGSETEFYTPIQIKSFSVAGEKFFSAIIDVETSPREEMLQNNPDFNIQRDTVFIKALIEGKKSLYIYTNKKGIENFYIKTQTGYDLLKYKKYYKEYTHIVKEQKLFIGQLRYYLGGFDGEDDIMQGLSYDQSSLENVFKRYYQESFEDKYWESPVEQLGINFGPILGISFISLYSLVEFSSPIDDRLFDLSMNWTMHYTAGAFAELIIPYTGKRLTLYNELIYSSYNLSAESISTDISYTDIRTYSIHATYANLNNLLRFNVAGNSLKFNIHAGLSNGLLLKEQDSLRVEKYYRDVLTSSEEGKLIEEIKKLETGIIIGAGLNYHKIFLDTRFQLGNGVSAGIHKTFTKRISFTAGYKF